MGAPILVQVRDLLDKGRFLDAATRLSNAAKNGDVAATAELAQWSIAGQIVPRDLQRARTLLAAAADAGDSDAGLLHASFLASGTGGTVDWSAAMARISSLDRPAAARQLALVEMMKLDQQGRPLDDFHPVRLSDRPSILHVPGFVSDAECRHMIDVGAPHLRPSVVVDPDSGKMIAHPVRTSDYAIFGVHTEDLVISSINRRLAVLTGTDYRQGEPLQLLRYGVGREYRAHMDALPNEPNQRVLTGLVYLNDGYEGGATKFPRIDLSFAGRRGDALIFSNVNSDDRPDPLSLHEGALVTAGVKMIATRWIRRGAFTYPPPRPILTALP